MKLRTVQMLATIALAFMVLHVPEVSAQRTNGTFVGTPAARQPTASQQRFNPTQNSVILPMANPVAPMGNPVAPMIEPPFVRFSSPGQGVVIPDQSRNRGNGYGRGRDVIYVPVPTYYYQPSYDYYPSLTPPPTIPGQLPGGYYNYQQPATFDSPNVTNAPPTSTFEAQPQTQPQPQYYPEPRMIINEPRPNHVVDPPAIGTPRAEVVARLGQPWGTVQSRGQETLYFDGVTVVVAADGRVISTR